MALHRYRVRAGAKTWNDPGPDLLRPLDNATAQLRTLLRKSNGQELEIRVDKGEWRKTNRRKVLAVMKLGNFETLTVAVHDIVIAQVKHEAIVKLAVDRCSVGVAVLWSLVKHQFPGIIFAGGYVYKETFPGFWSDHAWGDAFDGTQNLAKHVLNDDVFDWLVRMGKGGCAKFDYAIGSRHDHVVDASAPDYEVGPSGADPSHLWHCHISVVDHDGAKPPREGGHG